MLALTRHLFAFVTALSLLGANAAFAHDTSRHAAPKPGRVLITGDVEKRLRLDASDLARLPQQVVTVTFMSGSGAQTRTFTGPLLLDVLNLAQPDFDPAIKGDKLRHYVVATASDGYQAVVAWGEFDPEFGAKKILLAITEDGVSLADAGPRLVVPGDVRGGRYVSNTVSIRLRPNSDRN